MKKLIMGMALLFTPHVHADDTATINTVYSTITENYINPINSENLSIAGLKGLEKLDKDIKFANGIDNIYIYHNGKMSGLWKKPADLNGWVEVSVKALEAAKKKSQILQDHDYQLAERVIESAVQSLNDSSKYYPYSYEEPHAEDSNLRFAERVADNVLYLKVANFNTGIALDLKDSLAKNPNIQGIIIDLRGNQGGSLQTAIEIAKLFIDEDAIILSVKGKNDATTKFYTSDNPSTHNQPLAVLIDGNTASSAEVLAAALKEQAGAKLVGTISFGKGSIQDTYTFENGGKLALTAAYFYTPSGKKIEGIGLTPDFCTFGSDFDAKSASCGKEVRTGNEFDIDVAVSILTQN